jgi:hypothetical protein
MVPPSRKGKKSSSVPIAVPISDDVAARLSPLVDGRARNEPLLMHWEKKFSGAWLSDEQGRRPKWERGERRAWSVAARMMPLWHEALSIASQPRNLIPYCLRHSSIVRGLRAGLPVTLVAKVHDTSVAMIERHYAAFIVNAAEDLLRRALVPLASSPPGAPILERSG